MKSFSFAKFACLNTSQLLCPLSYFTGLRGRIAFPILIGVAKLILKQALKRRGLSKRQFAKRLGIEYNNVFRYFREGYDPKLSSLTKWAKALGCKVRDLLEE